MGTPVPKPSTEGLEVNGWQVPENIGELQWEDETLKPLFAKVGCTSDPNVVNDSMFCKMMCCMCNRVMFYV